MMRGWLPVAAIPTLSLIFPLLLCICPSFIRSLFFANFVRDYGDFNLMEGVESYGRNFYLTGEAGRLGCWHILPRALSQEAKRKKVSNKEMETLLTTQNYTIIVYLHGNGHSRSSTDRIDTYNVLSAMNLHVLCLDYRGFGDSAGYPSEAGVIADSMILFNYAKRMAGKNYIFLWGHSLGSGVATAAALKLSLINTALTGLILEAPFNNAIDAITGSSLAAAWRWTPWFDLLVKRSVPRAGLNFSSDIRIKRVACPILIMHSVDDDVIKVELAEKLRHMAISASRDVTFVKFVAGRGIVHHNINQVAELPLILKNFMNHCIDTQMHLKMR